MSRKWAEEYHGDIFDDDTEKALDVFSNIIAHDAAGCGGLKDRKSFEDFLGRASGAVFSGEYSHGISSGAGESALLDANRSGICHFFTAADSSFSFGDYVRSLPGWDSNDPLCAEPVGNAVILVRDFYASVAKTMLNDIRSGVRTDIWKEACADAGVHQYDGILSADIAEAADNFDPDAEAALWTDSKGHGRNGAQASLSELCDDMQACKDNVVKFAEDFRIAWDEIEKRAVKKHRSMDFSSKNCVKNNSKEIEK
jgi:hypothetical protein